MSDRRATAAEHAPSPTDGAPRLLHEYFACAARDHGERIAVDVPPTGDGRARERTSYRDLAAEAARLAASLREHIAGECVVAILLPRDSHHLYVAQLAVLGAGAAYTGLDPAFPDDHARFILDDSRSVALLTDRAGRERARALGVPDERVLDVVEISDRSGPAPTPVPPPVWLTPASLAYVIYTSGTTGRPKGVLIEHRSIVNLVRSDREKFALTVADRVAQGSSIAYDSSIEETWLALAAGATLVVMDETTARLGPDLVPWLRDEGITVLCPPPTLLRATGCEDPLAELPDLRLLYVGGEALPRDVADRWARGRWLENGYGPTECTVTVVRGRIEAGGPITIGRPVAGHRAWVVDESLAEVPDGTAGELVIGGVGVARGYLNRPEITAERFPVHPTLGRLYRTGDLVIRNAAGDLEYHGRIDSQVKLRGHRLELEAVDASLVRCAGVREAAARIQDGDGPPLLVAFVVPESPADPPRPDDLKAELARTLPAYMVPSRIATIERLPTSTGGKLDRRRLPTLTSTTTGDRVAARDDLEAHVASAVAEVLRLGDGVSVEADFFLDLGGDSLGAAMTVSKLRARSDTASVTVRDVYEARTVAGIAARLRAARVAAPDGGRATETAVGVSRPALTTCVQVLALAASLVLTATAFWFGTFVLLPLFLDAIGVIPFLVISPVIAAVALVTWIPLSVVMAASAKRVLIGRYRPLCAPVWGSFYLRNWLVRLAVRVVPWGAIEGTVFQCVALRALGARIGQRVHIHRGVDLLAGGWDLLVLEDDVTLARDSAVRLVELEAGRIAVGPVTLGAGATLDVRAAVGPDTIVAAGASLAPLSSLPRGGRVPAGERWDGVPARPAGRTPAPASLAPEARILSPLAHGLLVMGARVVIGAALAAPLLIAAIVAATWLDVGAEDVVGWLFAPRFERRAVLGFAAVTVALAPIHLVLRALLCRVLGRVPPGSVSRWSPTWIRVALAIRMLEGAGTWLSGTVFWPIWLRAAGMRVGRRCEISTIIDVVPALVEIGEATFFADGIYLGGPHLHRGVVTLARTRLGSGTFLGNHAVVPAGQTLPDGILIGVCTVADETRIRGGTSWFGHPPFELPRREVVTIDRRLTHEPDLLRWTTRLFWETLRFALPVVPLLLALVWLDQVAAGRDDAVRVLARAAGATLGVAAFLCALVLGSKWLLLGRTRPGQHALWSCWCSRWDFLYVAWGFWARGPLSALEGTKLLPWYLRAMGVRVGRRTTLGRGFAQVVDPDMLDIADDATFDGLFQAHSFEDRVLKLDRVRVGAGATIAPGAVLFYGADIGAGAYVAPGSVVMKRERLLSHHVYEGCPTVPAGRTSTGDA